MPRILFVVDVVLDDGVARGAVPIRVVGIHEIHADGRDGRPCHKARRAHVSDQAKELDALGDGHGCGRLERAGAVRDALLRAGAELIDRAHGVGVRLENDGLPLAGVEITELFGVRPSRLGGIQENRVNLGEDVAG